MCASICLFIAHQAKGLAEVSSDDKLVAIYVACHQEGTTQVLLWRVMATLRKSGGERSADGEVNLLQLAVVPGLYNVPCW